MAFLNNPNATATVTVAEPVFVAPGPEDTTDYSYDFEDYEAIEHPDEYGWVQHPDEWVVDVREQTINHPAQTAYSNDGTGASGWSTAFIANGSGATKALMVNTESGASAPPKLYLTTSGGTTSVHPTPSVSATRTITGLAPGQVYNVSARISSWSTQLRSRVSFGTASSAWVTNTGEVPVSFTFTPSSTSAVLKLESVDNPDIASGTSIAIMYADDILITRGAYTETIPEQGHWEAQSDTWEIVTPAHTEVINNGLGGWAGSNIGNTAYVAHSGTRALVAYDCTVSRSIGGLVAGHEYTVKAWAQTYEAGEIASIGVSGKGTDNVEIPLNVWVPLEYTFTATAASHTFTMDYPAAIIWDDVALVHHYPDEYTLTPELKLSDGDATLDAGRYPYAEASVEVPFTGEELLEQLEVNQRVVINATEGETVATLNLALRERTVSHDNKTITLKLASDEALLYTWADVVDDKTPRTHEANLRNLCNYVLGKAIPGAALQPGSANADITARWDAENAILNPNVANLTGYTSAGNLTLSHSGTANAGVEGATGYLVGTSAAAGQAFVSAPQTVSARKGQMWTFSTHMHKGNGISATLNGILRVYEIDSNNSTVRQIESTPRALPASGGSVPYTWQRHSVTFVVENPNTTKLMVYGSFMATAGGQAVAMDGFMLTEGPILLPFFSGSTAPAGYVANWTGQTPTPNNSVSERRPSDGIERMPELFTWKAGQTAWDFLEPLVASAGLRLFCDEQRRWYLIDPAAYVVPGRFSARPDNTVEGTDTIDAEDENSGVTGVVVNYTWTDSDGITHEEVDAAGVAGKVKVLTMEREFPGTGIAAAHLAKIQGQGRIQDVTVRTDYTVRPGQEIQIDLPGTFAQLGTLTQVRWELTTGLMSLGSSQLRETPPGSIDLLTGTIDGLPGSIDSL